MNKALGFVLETKSEQTQTHSLPGRAYSLVKKIILQMYTWDFDKCLKGEIHDSSNSNNGFFDLVRMFPMEVKGTLSSEGSD